MRKNKTYEQQKKYYDGNNEHESLGDIFMYWLECSNETAASMQETYRECNRECKEFIWEDSTTFVTTKELSIEKRSTSSLESSTLARSNMERSANRGAISRSIRETAQV